MYTNETHEARAIFVFTFTFMQTQMRRPRITPTKRGKIFHARGTHAEIAKRYNVSTASVTRIKKIGNKPELIRTPKPPTILERLSDIESRMTKIEAILF